MRDIYIITLGVAPWHGGRPAAAGARRQARAIYGKCTCFLRHTQASNLREFIELYWFRESSDPMSTSAESLEEVHLSDMSAEGKREQQALMRGKSIKINLARV